VTVQNWLENALQDADRRQLPALRPLLEALARSTATIRAADWNLDPADTETGERPGDQWPETQVTVNVR
jgi:hypothetical protein